MQVTNYKLNITLCGLAYYRIGDGPSSADWFTDTKSVLCPSVKTNAFQLVNETKLFYNVTVTYQSQVHNFTTYNVSSLDADSSFTGTEIH